MLECLKEYQECKCSVCGKQYKRFGWLRNHKKRFSHWTEGEFILLCEPDPFLSPFLLTVGRG